jgi:hypothetical protein
MGIGSWSVERTLPHWWRKFFVAPIGACRAAVGGYGALDCAELLTLFEQADRDFGEAVTHDRNTMADS